MFSSNKSVATNKKSFKMESSLEERKAEAAHLREQCPDRVPVIIEKAKHSDHVPELVKNKSRLLVPGTCTVGQFVHLIRRNMNLDPTKAIFVFVNDTLPPVASLMSSLYEENKEEDGFLYMVYSGENVFGRHSETLEWPSV